MNKTFKPIGKNRIMLFQTYFWREVFSFSDMYIPDLAVSSVQSDLNVYCLKEGCKSFYVASSRVTSDEEREKAGSKRRTTQQTLTYKHREQQKFSAAFCTLLIYSQC